VLWDRGQPSSARTPSDPPLPAPRADRRGTAAVTPHTLERCCSSCPPLPLPVLARGSSSTRCATLPRCWAALHSSPRLLSGGLPCPAPLTPTLNPGLACQANPGPQALHAPRPDRTTRCDPKRLPPATPSVPQTLHGQELRSTARRLMEDGEAELRVRACSWRLLVPKDGAVPRGLGAPPMALTHGGIACLPNDPWGLPPCVVRRWGGSRVAASHGPMTTRRRMRVRTLAPHTPLPLPQRLASTASFLEVGADIQQARGWAALCALLINSNWCAPLRLHARVHAACVPPAAPHAARARGPG